jgi:hypothetical protein
MRRLARVMASAETRSTTSSIGMMMCLWRSVSKTLEASTVPLSVCPAILGGTRNQGVAILENGS